MANIPVEKTSTGFPWWLLLLGLLLLAGLLWFLLADDDDDVAVVDDVEVVDDAAVAGDFLDLSDVYVTRVVGDNTFFVAPTEGGTDETLVYLEEEPDPTDNVEGRYDVTVGQHLAITGSMEPTPADVTPWGLTAEQAAMVGDQYVRATSLTILDGADGDAAALDLATLGGDLSAYVGRMTALDGVRVTELVGDSTFYVGEGDQQVLVVLESLGEAQSGPGDGSDGVFDVNVGDVVGIDGEVMAFRRGMRGTSSMDEAAMVAAEQRRYVVVVDERGEFSKN